MKVRYSVVASVVVVMLTIFAAGFRVSTAPERARLRMETARTACTAGGGEWAVEDGHEVCRSKPAK